jgi:hypothetical protein
LKSPQRNTGARMVARQKALSGARRHIRSTGNDMNRMCSPAHRGRLIVAPLWPRAVQARLVRANAAKADYRFGAKSRPRWYRASCRDRQEETAGVLLIDRARDPETDDAVPTAGCSTATISRADLVFKAGPGTAAEAMVAAIAGHPWRSVDRCAPIILV